MPRSLLAISALFLSTALFAAEKPNVVFILADDLGWADLGCYGSKYHRTPNLDRLAKEGVRFTQAYAAAPVCSPTRAAILTGQHPARLGITDWLPGRPDRPDQKLARPALVNDLPADAPNLATVFKKAGYATGLIGKWHLGGASATPEKRGFDINIAGDSTGTALSYFAPFGVKGRFMPGLEKAPEGEYITDRLAAEAERFIEAHKDGPFFLYLPQFAPHIPLKAKADIVAKYKAGGIGQQGNPNYAAMLESLDEAVGRVLKKLDDLKLTENTVVVFTSDNGGLCVLEGDLKVAATINAPLREGKGYLYEGGIRVPLIVKWPGMAKVGHTSTVPVNSVDFLPTFDKGCELKVDSVFDGRNFVPALRDEAMMARPLIWHYPHYSNQGGKPSGAIRIGDYKLIEFYETGRRELFDVDKDPGENQNLSEARPNDVLLLGDELAQWRTTIGAKMPTPNAAYKPHPPGKDGSIVLPARMAEVHGVMLRYEPLPHKETLGYWVRKEDYATWEFTIEKPGTFTIEVLQGCGKGHGGSEVEVKAGATALKFVVEDTGHFQNFKPRDIGTAPFEKPGRYTLEIRPKTKPGGAVMDVRQVTLRPK